MSNFQKQIVVVPKQTFNLQNLINWQKVWKTKNLVIMKLIKHYLSVMKLFPTVFQQFEFERYFFKKIIIIF